MKPITWLPGVTYTQTETRVVGNRMEFGYRIDGGDFKPTCSMEFDNKADLAQAALIALEVMK